MSTLAVVPVVAPFWLHCLIVHFSKEQPTTRSQYIFGLEKTLLCALQGSLIASQLWNTSCVHHSTVRDPTSQHRKFPNVLSFPCTLVFPSLRLPLRKPSHEFVPYVMAIQGLYARLLHKPIRALYFKTCAPVLPSQ